MKKRANGPSPKYDPKWRQADVRQNIASLLSVDLLFDGSTEGTAELYYHTDPARFFFHAATGGHMAARCDDELYTVAPSVTIVTGGKNPVANLLLPNEEHLQGTDLDHPDQKPDMKAPLRSLFRIEHWNGPRAALLKAPDTPVPVPRDPESAHITDCHGHGR